MATKSTPSLDHLSSKNGDVARTPLTQRRYTPYTKSNQRTQALTKTPLPNFHQKQRDSKRSIRQQPSQLVLVDAEPSNDIKTEDISTRIVNKTWRVYRVSPLFRFKTDRQSLSGYEKRLNTFLALETCGAADEVQSKAKKKAVFTKVEGDSDGDYGVEMKITTSESKESGSKDELVAVLCCGGSNIIDDEQALIAEMTTLPVCLIKSPVLLKDIFLQWLEGQFGCRFCPLLFSPTDLAWMVSLCAGIGEPKNPVELTYSVPAVVEGLDTIYFKMEGKDARKIWNAVHDSEQPYFTNEEAVKFLKSMESHFYHHFKIHLDQMQLTTVATSVAYIGQEGRVKILQEAYVCYILQQLSQLSNL